MSHRVKEKEARDLEGEFVNEILFLGVLYWVQRGAHTGAKLKLN